MHPLPHACQHHGNSGKLAPLFRYCDSSLPSTITNTVHPVIKTRVVPRICTGNMVLLRDVPFTYSLVPFETISSVTFRYWLMLITYPPSFPSHWPQPMRAFPARTLSQTPVHRPHVTVMADALFHYLRLPALTYVSCPSSFRFPHEFSSFQ